MRCYCCNRNLNDYESTLKSAVSGEFLDTCQRCLDGMGIETMGRSDLSPFEQIDQEEFDWDDLEVDEDEPESL